MKKQLRKIALACVSVLLGGISGLAMAEPTEMVIGLDVQHARAYVSAMEDYYGSGGAQDIGVALWTNAFEGASDVTHTLVIEFDDYDELEKVTDARNSDPAWTNYLRSINGLIDIKSRTMAIERLRDGSGWRQHGALAAFIMTVTDPATYAAAFAELIDSSENPGSVRLMELRFGGQGATHAALISAEGPAALNEYLDGLLSSDAYREFSGKVSGIRTIQNVAMYRRVASFGK